MRITPFLILTLFIIFSSFTMPTVPEKCFDIEHNVDPSQVRYPAIDRSGDIFYCYEKAENSKRDLASDKEKKDKS